MRRIGEEFYSEVDGDYDEKAYNSNLFIQKFWQRHKIESVLNYVKRGEFVLDLGSGSGVVSDKIANMGCEVVAADLSLGKIKNCRKKNPQTLGVVCDGRDLPFKEGSFDRVICIEVIEHIPQAEKCVSEISRVLGDNGELVLTTPNYRSLWPVVEYLWDTLGKGIDYRLQHVSKFNKDSLVKSLGTGGLEVLEVRTIFFFTPLSSLFSKRLTTSIVKLEEKFLHSIDAGMLVVVLARRMNGTILYPGKNNR